MNAGLPLPPMELITEALIDHQPVLVLTEDLGDAADGEDAA
jgi:hypothetical protein